MVVGEQWDESTRYMCFSVNRYSQWTFQRVPNGFKHPLGFIWHPLEGAGIHTVFVLWITWALIWEPQFGTSFIISFPHMRPSMQPSNCQPQSPRLDSLKNSHATGRQRPNSIGSMGLVYIFLHEWLIFMVNVGKIYHAWILWELDHWEFHHTLPGEKSFIEKSNWATYFPLHWLFQRNYYNGLIKCPHSWVA